MRMRNEIFIAAPAQRIYQYACATERWPEYLPHYRFVHVLESNGNSRVVEMAAYRSGIPVRWIAEQTNDAATPSIRFKHLRGWTRGMEVEWRFEPTSSGTRVSIEHELDFRFPFASQLISRRVIGEFFIHSIASKTLARMKELSEAP